MREIDMDGFIGYVPELPLQARSEMGQDTFSAVGAVPELPL